MLTSPVVSSTIFAAIPVSPRMLRQDRRSHGGPAGAD
jgi:hypothetical protein